MCNDRRRGCSNHDNTEEVEIDWSYPEEKEGERTRMAMK